MAQLPPVVIVKGEGAARVFLGATGWTPHRQGALSFETEAQARDWISNGTKPLMMHACVVRVEHAIENPGQPEHVNEYDPTAAA